ncbi:MAG: hemerythrin domain-containing protein [Pseudomonadota bacterium]
MKTISSFLAADHARCDALLSLTREAVRIHDWSEATRNLSAFARTANRHLSMEEDIVFAAYEQGLGHPSEPCAMLRSEHRLIRGMAVRMADALDQADGLSFYMHADTLRILLHQHGEKEEGVLYPAIERLLAPRLSELIDAMARFVQVDPAGSAA